MGVLDSELRLLDESAPTAARTGQPAPASEPVADVTALRREIVALRRDNELLRERLNGSLTDSRPREPRRRSDPAAYLG